MFIWNQNLPVVVSNHFSEFRKNPKRTESNILNYSLCQISYSKSIIFHFQKIFASLFLCLFSYNRFICSPEICRTISFSLYKYFRNKYFNTLLTQLWNIESSIYSITWYFVVWPLNPSYKNKNEIKENNLFESVFPPQQTEILCCTLEKDSWNNSLAVSIKI